MTLRRRQMRTAKELDACSGRLPGDVEDDMLGRLGLDITALEIR
jgi:hypothetical protein